MLKKPEWPGISIVNGYVGNLAPMPGVFPDYPAPVVSC
jgi:hypothetical protein